MLNSLFEQLLFILFKDTVSLFSCVNSLWVLLLIFKQLFESELISLFWLLTGDLGSAFKSVESVLRLNFLSLVSDFDKY